jgi:thiol-disulfide isomerase/thioredoxin
MAAGVIVLIVALAAALAAGATVRLRAGKVRFFSRTPHGDSVPAPGDARTQGAPTRGASAQGAGTQDTLTQEDLGSPLGERATLVQFSTEYCAYCGPTREVLGEIAGGRDGVAVIEIDAAERMDLAKRLRVFTTPTVLVLGSDGEIAARSTGRPRKAELARAVWQVLGDEPGSLEETG